MQAKFFKIEPDLRDDEVACIDDWKFTHWPVRPAGEIVKNPDGTYSVVIPENFVPLVTQLQNLFKNGKAPENGTYLGEAVLTGKNEPADCIYGNFINKYEGLIVSNRLLNLLQNYTLPEHYVYNLPLIRKRKTYNNYSFILFKEDENRIELDVRLLKDGPLLVVCVSEKLMSAIQSANMRGCAFTEMNAGK